MHKKFISEKKKYINLCEKDNIYKLEYNGNCLKNCPNETYISEDKTLCINNNASKADINSQLASNFEASVMNGDFDFSNTTDDNIIVIKIGDELSMSAGTIDSMRNNSNKNDSSIDLGECIDELRDHYNLTQDHPLIMIVKDYKTDDQLIAKIDYDIIDQKSKTKLNLSYCVNAKEAKISVPSNIG